MPLGRFPGTLLEPVAPVSVGSGRDPTAGGPLAELSSCTQARPGLSGCDPGSPSAGSIVCGATGKRTRVPLQIGLSQKRSIAERETRS